MATFHWYGGWTGNTGFNSGFSTNGLIGPSAQSLWTSVFTGFSTDKGDYAFGPYYWGFIENWRERTLVGGNARIDFATRLPRGGDTIFIGPASGSVTGPGHTHKIPVSLLFGGLTNGTAWLGSTAGTTGSFKHAPCNITVLGQFGRKPNLRYYDGPGYLPNPNFSIYDQPLSGMTSAGYNYTELPYVKFDQPGSADEFFKNSSSSFFIGGPTGTSGFYLQYRDRAPRIGAGVYWDPFPLYISGGLTATSSTPWAEESGVPRRYRASLHIGSVGFDNGEPIDIYGRDGLTTKRVMQGALEGIPTYPGITSTFCTLPQMLVNGINIKTTVRSSGCTILRTLTMDPYSLYSSDAPINITAAAVSQLPKSTLFGVLVNEDNSPSGNTITFNSPSNTTIDAAIPGSNTHIRKMLINQKLDMIGGVGTGNDISVTFNGGGCNGGKVAMAVFLPDDWNITHIPFTLQPWHGCFVSYTQPTDAQASIHYRQAKLDDITSGLTAFVAKSSVSDNWYGSAHISFFVNESDTPKLLRIPTGVTHAPNPSNPSGCYPSSEIIPTAKAIFLIGRNASTSLPIALTGDSGGLSADSNGLDPIDIISNGGYFQFQQSGTDTMSGSMKNHNAKVAIRSIGLTFGTYVSTFGGYNSTTTGPDSANLKFAGKISTLSHLMGGFEALSFEGVETNFLGNIFCSDQFSKLVLNENTNEAESGLNSVSVNYQSKKLSEVTIPCAVIGDLKINYVGSTAASDLTQSQTPNINIGSRSGTGVKTYANVEVSLDYFGMTAGVIDPISTGDVLKVYSAQIDYLNLKSGTISPASDALPIGIYPIFREGVIQNGRILTNIQSNPNWNNSLIGFSPNDIGLKIADSNARLGERDRYSILFSPGMNIKTTPGEIYPGLT
jgi:hypothetical protein